jgi:hypothetical protein
MSGCAKDGFEVVRSYCLELARTKATSIFARSLPMEPKAAQSNLDAGGNCTTKPSEASSRICARGAPVATRSRKSRASSALGSRPPVFGFGSVRLERVHVEHDVKRAENRAERLEWEAGFATTPSHPSSRPTLRFSTLSTVIGDLHTPSPTRGTLNREPTWPGRTVAPRPVTTRGGWCSLFKEFQNSDPNQVPQLLSDHPAKGLGSKRLSNTFLHNTSVFSKFDSSFVPMGRNRSVLVSRYLN